MSSDRLVVYVSVAVAILTSAVALVVVGRVWWARWRQLRRMRLGKQAEPLARALLVRRGYEIDQVQARKRVFVVCDGKAQAFDVFADFLVCRAGKKYVADSKTGDCASITDRSTRRQLLEYALVF